MTTMTQRHRYLTLARAALEGPAETRSVNRAAAEDAVIPPAVSAAGAAGDPPDAPAPSDERNERNEVTRIDSDTRRRLVMGRWRVTLSPSLRHWDDDTLVALAAWHLAIAFGRAGANGFRRQLPPSLKQLSDDDLDVLVDWPSLATLEQVSWHGNATSAEQLSVGAQRLAAWWNARRDAERAPQNLVRSRPTAKAQPDERLPGI